jgi:transposase, IS5 family
MDGGFASKDNVKLAKGKGVEDVSFCKRCGIEVTELVKGTWVYKRLTRFRAGVEAGISFLKRCCGMDRCRWRGLQTGSPAAIF